MAANPAALARLRLWAAYNFAPPLPLQLTPRTPVQETDPERIKALAQAAGVAPPPAGAGTPTPQPAESRLTPVWLMVQAAIGTRQAVSAGPFGYPWRLRSFTLGTNTMDSNFSWQLYATPVDFTDVTTGVFGDRIITARASNLPNIEAGGINESGLTAVNPQHYFEGSGWQAPGTWLTLEGESVGSAAALFLALRTTVEERAAMAQLPAFDPELLRLRLQVPTPKPPPPRSIIPQPPAAVRVSGPGFSRTIPWELLDPSIKKEYLVNLVNGKPTPGVFPL